MSQAKAMRAKEKKPKVKDPVEDKILYAVVGTVLVLFTIVVLYPLIYVLSSSFSSGNAVSTGRVVFFPVEPTLEGYKTVFANRFVLPSYANTIFYTVVGTVINLAITLTCAYPLSRRDFPMRRGFSLLFLFTMYFGGGLIPSYILMSKIGFLNSRWVLLIPGALSVYNMILVRTFF